MSASQEKKKRRELKAETPEVTKAKKKEAKNKTAKKTIITIVVIVVVIALIFAIVWNSALFYTGVNALSIGNWKYNAAEYNYFFNNRLYANYETIYNTYGDYTYLLLDLNKPLTEQDYSEEQTWAERIKEETLDRMQQLSMLNDAAAAEGWKLSPEQAQEVQTAVDSVKSSAANIGYSLKAYLNAYYGKYLTEDLFRELVTKETIAKYYAIEQIDRLSFTDEELDARYAENASDYDLVTYYGYTASGAADEENGIDEDTAMNRAYEAATAIAGAATEESFAELVYNYAPDDYKDLYKDPDYCRHENVPPANLAGDAGKWLTDPAREYGDTTVIENDNGYSVYMYVESNDNSYELRSFRVLLCLAATDGDTGTVTTDTVAAAKSEADAFYADWLADPTEDHFAQLCTANSDDTRTNANGGLYTDVSMGYLDEGLEAWIFDEARQPGDTDIIYCSNTSYTGYHIVYYVGEGERYDRTIARSLMETDWSENWRASNEAAYPISTGFGFGFVKKK